MKIVYVQFNGFPYEVALELRSEPGVFTQLGWLEDEQHNDYNDYLMSDEARGDWNDFHKATDDAFCELGAKSVWINSTKIQYIREARERTKNKNKNKNNKEEQKNEEEEAQDPKEQKPKQEIHMANAKTGCKGAWHIRKEYGALDDGFMVLPECIDAPDVIAAGSMTDSGGEYIVPEIYGRDWS